MVPNKQTQPTLEIGTNVTIIIIIVLLILLYSILNYGWFIAILLVMGMILVGVWIFGKYFGGAIGTLLGLLK